MTTPKAHPWLDAPMVGIPQPPALICDTETLWLAYQTAKEKYAVAKFSGVIDHWLSPINDEGIGKHPYIRSGLQFYTFHEIENSPEAEEWRGLGARHWVITFKDNALDVVAFGVEIVARQIDARRATQALLSVFPLPDDEPGVVGCR